MYVPTKLLSTKNWTVSLNEEQVRKNVFIKQINNDNDIPDGLHFGNKYLNTREFG